MGKNILFAGIILICSYGLSAQNMINTDRPDQSDGTHIVEKNLIQIETGLQFHRTIEGERETSILLVCNEELVVSRLQR